MKNRLIIALLLPLLAILIAGSDNFTGNNAESFNKTSLDSLPAEVQDVINFSCINCHAPGGRALAVAKLNFTEWNEYDSEKQIKKGEAMCAKITKGSMPPKSYLRDHPEQAPTAEQIDIICKWAESLREEQ